MSNSSPEFIMLVGLPGSGKSTYIQRILIEYPEKEYIVLSTDNIIEAWGSAEGLTYTQAFNKFNFKKAQSAFNVQFRQALNAHANIIVDRTNLTPKGRAKMLSQVLSDYKKIAVVFEVESNELKRRLNERAEKTGKFIPEKVVAQMMASYQPPSRSEFDVIKRV